MDADIKRQRMLNAPSAIFNPVGNSSLGSLPRGEIKVRRDTITIASVNQGNDFKIGASERTKEVPRSVLEAGMRKYAERNATFVERRQDVRFDITARQASLTPSAFKTDQASLPTQVISGGVQTAAPDTAFASGEGLTNPTNRIV